MGLFENFPYTNFHELNLDWLLEIVKKLDSKFDEWTDGQFEEWLNEQLENGTLQDIIENVLGDEINIVSLGIVANDENSAAANTERFNQIFSLPFAERPYFYFPKGTYYINNTIYIKNGANIKMHPRAILKASAQMDCMLSYNPISLDYNNVTNPLYLGNNTVLEGGFFDGNNLARTCIGICQSFASVVRHVQVYNFVTCGIDCNYVVPPAGNANAELLLNDIRVQQPYDAKRTSTGISMANDVICDNLFFYNVTLPVKMTGGGNFINNVHAWISNTPELANAAHFCESPYGIDNNFSNIFIDSFCKVVLCAPNKPVSNTDVSGNVVFTNLKILYTGYDTTKPTEIFDSNLFTTAINLSITTSQNKIPYTTNADHPYNIINYMGADSWAPENPSLYGVGFANFMTGAKQKTTLWRCDNGFYYGVNPQYGPNVSNSTQTNYQWFHVQKLSTNTLFAVCYNLGDAGQVGVYVLAGNIESGKWTNMKDGTTVQPWTGTPGPVS